MNFCTLPVEVLGRGVKMMRLGALKWAICSRQNAISSAWLSTRPYFSFTKAQGTSPHFSSGMAITAASSTSGWR